MTRTRECTFNGSIKLVWKLNLRPSVMGSFCVLHHSNQCKVLEKGLKCKNCGKVRHLVIVCQSKAHCPQLPHPIHTFSKAEALSSSNSSDDLLDEKDVHREVGITAF